MSHTFRYGVYLAIVVAALFLTYLLSFSFKDIPHGIFLPMTTHHYPATKSMTLYRHMPADAQAVGHVNIEQHFKGQPSPDAVKPLLQYAAHMAMKAGANGLVIHGLGATPLDTTPAPLRIYLLRAVAIRTNNKSE